MQQNMTPPTPVFVCLFFVVVFLFVVGEGLGEDVSELVLLHWAEGLGEIYLETIRTFSEIMEDRLSLP